MTNERKGKSQIDRSKGTYSSNLPKADYRFVFEENLSYWCGKKRVREERLREEKEIDARLQAKKTAYHRSMPSIGRG